MHMCVCIRIDSVSNPRGLALRACVEGVAQRLEDVMGFRLPAGNQLVVE